MNISQNDLSALSDHQLMRNTKTLVQKENTLLVNILRHIKEIDRRRLCAKYKQPGLLELVMAELGYSRDEALRRVKAMRMIRENPVVEEKVERGDLNLTTIGIVQVLFSHEKREGKPLSREEKLEVIESVSGKSSREAQRIALSLCSTPPKLSEKIKMIAPDLYELTSVIDEETKLIMEQLKGMLAHSHPNISNGELLKILGNLGLKEFHRVKEPSDKPVAAPPPISKAEVKRQIWHRDGHKCRNCGSTYAIQEDHRWPKSKGGSYTTANMRLLCRSCNQRAAIQHFGVHKMEEHFKQPADSPRRRPAQT